MIPVSGCFLRSKSLSRLDPDLWSTPGQFSVLLWAGAYYTASQDVGPGASIWALFAVEKAFYVAMWVKWLATHDPVKVLKSSFSSSNPHDILQAAFYLTYGAGDALFGLWFLHVYQSK